MIPAKLKLPTAYVDLDMMIFGLGRKTVFKKCYGINPKLVPELARFYKEGIRFTHDYLLRLAKEPGAVWAQTLLKLEEQFVKPSETSGSFIVSMYPLGKGRHVLDAFDKEREQKPCLPVVPPPPMAEILVGRYFSHYFEGTSLSTEKIEQLELVARGDRDLPMEFVGLREEAIERFQGLSPLPQMLIKAIKLYEILIEDERDVQSLNSAENVRRLAKKRSSAIFSLINKPEYLAEPETGEFLIQLIKDEVDSVYIITLAVFGLRKIFDLGTEHPLWLTLKEEFLQMAVRLESSETERYGAVAALESLSEKSDREIAVFISATEDVYLVREKAVLALTSLPESQKSGPVFAALIKLAGCEQRTRIYDMMQRQFVEWLKAGRERQVVLFALFRMLEIGLKGDLAYQTYYMAIDSVFNLLADWSDQEKEIFLSNFLHVIESRRSTDHTTEIIKSLSNELLEKFAGEIRPVLQRYLEHEDSLAAETQVNIVLILKRLGSE